MLEVVRLGYDMLEVVNIFQDISLSQVVQRRPIARVTVGLSVAGQVSGSDSRLGPSLARTRLARGCYSRA